MQTKYKRKLSLNHNTYETSINDTTTVLKKFKQSVKKTRIEFYKKYKLESNTYHVKQINDIIYNEKANIVALFKDFLIFDDSSEFLKRYYKTKESADRLPRLYDYYENYSKIFPNYIILSEAKYIYKNIQKKQRIIDNQQLNEIRQKDLKDHSLSNLFDTRIYKSILNQSDCSMESNKSKSSLQIFRENKDLRNFCLEDFHNEINQMNDLIEHIDRIELTIIDKNKNICSLKNEINQFRQSDESFYSKNLKVVKDSEIASSNKLINNFVVTSKAVTYTNKHSIKSHPKDPDKNHNLSNIKSKITPKNCRDGDGSNYSRPQSSTHSKNEISNRDISNKNKIINIVNSNLNKQKERKFSNNFNYKVDDKKPQPFIIEDNAESELNPKNDDKFVYVKQSPVQNSLMDDAKFNNTSNNIYYIINQNQNSNTHINIYPGENTVIKTLKRTIDPNDNFKERHPFNDCKEQNSSKLGKKTIDNHRRVFSDALPIGKEVVNNYRDQFEDRKKREDLKNMLKILESRKKSTIKNNHQRNSSLIPTSSISNKTKSILNENENAKNHISPSTTATYKFNINSSDFKQIEVSETPINKKYNENEINSTSSKKGTNINDLRRSINNVASFHKKNFSYKFNINHKNKTLETGKNYTTNKNSSNLNFATKDNSKAPPKSVVCTGSLNFEDGTSKPVYIRSIGANEVKSIHVKNNSLNTIDYNFYNSRPSYPRATIGKKN